MPKTSDGINYLTVGELIEDLIGGLEVEDFGVGFEGGKEDQRDRGEDGEGGEGEEDFGENVAGFGGRHQAFSRRIRNWK